MEKNKFITIEQARANLFNIFSALFCQPEDEILKNPELFGKMSHFSDLLEIDNAKDIKNFEKALYRYTEKELLIEYARLFVGPFKTVAPPYSSVYLGSDSLMSDDTIWVLEQYHKNGLDFKPDSKDLPDHIAVETGFLYYLIYKEIKQLEEDNIQEANTFFEGQQTFLNEHFLKWVPPFCRKGLDNTNNEYYKYLFRLMNQFIQSANQYDFPSIN